MHTHVQNNFIQYKGISYTNHSTDFNLIHNNAAILLFSRVLLMKTILTMMKIV